MLQASSRAWILTIERLHLRTSEFAVKNQKPKYSLQNVIGLSEWMDQSRTCGQGTVSALALTVTPSELDYSFSYSQSVGSGSGES